MQGCGAAACAEWACNTGHLRHARSDRRSLVRDEQHVGRESDLLSCDGPVTAKHELTDNSRGVVTMQQCESTLIMLTFRVTSPRSTMAASAPMDTLHAVTRRLKSPSVCISQRGRCTWTYCRGSHLDGVHDVDVTCLSSDVARGRYCFTLGSRSRRSLAKASGSAHSVYRLQTLRPRLWHADFAW